MEYERRLLTWLNAPFCFFVFALLLFSRRETGVRMSDLEDRAGAWFSWAPYTTEGTYPGGRPRPTNEPGI